jgi:hypothetical protein
LRRPVGNRVRPSSRTRRRKEWRKGGCWPNRGHQHPPSTDSLANGKPAQPPRFRTVVPRTAGSRPLATDGMGLAFCHPDPPRTRHSLSPQFLRRLAVAADALAGARTLGLRSVPCGRRDSQRRSLPGVSLLRSIGVSAVNRNAPSHGSDVTTARLTEAPVIQGRDFGTDTLTSGMSDRGIGIIDMYGCHHGHGKRARPGSEART